MWFFACHLDRRADRQDLVTERSELPELQPQEGLWRVGQRVCVIRHVVTDGELRMFDTNSRMLNMLGG